MKDSQDEKQKVPRQVYKSEDIVEKMLMDLANKGISQVIVNDSIDYNEISKIKSENQEYKNLSITVKSEESIFKVGIFENKFLIGSFILGVLIQTIVVIIPTFANIFSLVPLTSTQWIIVAIISILPIPIMELQKKVDEIKFGKVIYTEKQKT